MASAWVTCQRCRVLITLGKELMKNNKAYCCDCFDKVDYIHKDVVKKRRKKR